TLSGGALAAVLDQNAAAGVPVWLLRATFRIATGQAACPVGIAALAKGVLQAMLLERLKIVVAVCCVAGLLSAGVGAVALRSVAAEPETPKKKLTRPQKAEELLPTDPLPTPVVVALDSGEIVVKHRVVMYHAERQPDGSIAWRPTHELHERRHAAEEVRAYNTRGEEVDADDLAHLLRKEALAFAYLNGQKVDL